VTVEDDLRRLSDIEAIKQLRGRYSRAIDTKDWDGFGASIADDARFSTDGGVHEGRDTIVASVSGALATARTVHHQHTPVIEITGPDAATGTWAMQDIVDFGTSVLRGFGYYVEEYVRTSDGWKIQSSTLERLRVDTEGEVPSR
jgi:uncharacterized protein (TIGR02246 family)